MSRDFIGRAIAAGDTVVYPVRRGSSMWLNKMNVTQVADDHITGFNSDGRRITVKNLNNTVVVQPVAETEAAPAAE
jgi:hypothetical protein